MKKYLKLIGTVLMVMALAASIGACSEQKAAKQDIKEPKGDSEVLPDHFEAKVPEVLTLYRNVDDHPTIVKVCIEGIAWRTLSTTHSKSAGSAVRVPEWDDTCPGYDPNRQQFPSGSQAVVTEQAPPS